MELYKKILFCITWLVTLYIIGILLFTKGFLLTRFVITNNSSCRADFGNETSSDKDPSHQGDGCWLKPLRKRAVFIVIDALRYDFVAHVPSSEKSHPMPYENKLRTLQNLLEDKPQNARLYKFMADPPTTTLQRLKGLTTGSLPTFIDVASNFDSSAISEDNIIDQLASLNKTLVFMGDDTWVNLFPGRFRRSYPFPSFNVKDLHTVDNGVIKHLVPELQRTDWDVLIAHFLGVDHCGHRYGPYHPAMANKLSQMNEVLKSVIELLDEDTVLFVLGDHGMTKTGDHGGDSKDELQAALFVYSPTELTQSGRQNKSQHEAIFQTDLVPTVSLLLGTPIPFSNLGTLIVDLFNNSIDHEDAIQRKIASELHIIDALKLNVNQVRKFIQTYASVSDEFSNSLLLDLERRYIAAETELDSVVGQLHGNHDHDGVIILSKLHKIRDQYLLYLSTTRMMCQEVWAKFDLSLMALGIILTMSVIILSVFWLSSFKADAPFRWQPVVIGCVGSFWMMSLVSLLAIVHLNLTDVIISLVIICAFIIVFGIIAAKLTMDFKQVTYFSWPLHHAELIPAFVIVVYSLSLFSNSYIVFEDAVSAYLLQSVVAYNGWCIVCKLYDQSKTSSQKVVNKKNKIQSFDIARQLTSPVSLTILTVFLTNSAVRLSSMFRACREEQWMCEPSNWLLPISSLAEDLRQYKNLRYCISVGCLIGFSVIVTKWLQYWGNLNGYMPCVLSIKYLFPFGTVSIALYWAVQAVPSKLFDNLPVWQVTFFPRIVYVVIIVMLLCMLWNPLCLFLVPRTTQSQPLISNPQSENLLPQMFNHLKANWKKHLHSTSVRSGQSPSTGGGPPIVYGLATVFSASHIVLITSIVLLLFMLLGDNLSPSVFLYITTAVMLLELNASLVEVSETSGFHVSWTSILTWSLLASEHFFSTGHQTVVTTIQWQSAFHGFHGDFEYYLLPAALILMNTFASYILTVVSLPLLVFWPRMRRGIIFHYDKPKKAGEVKDSRGEFILHEEEHKLWFAMFQILAGFITIEGLKVLATMCCAMIHRRHLMVWKIFAPRFLFESVTFLIIGPLSILVYLFVVRVNQAIRSWIKLLDR